MIIVYLADRGQETTFSPKEIKKKIVIYVIENIFFLIFGILFYAFQDNPEKNDYCDQNKFKLWAKATAIICFIYCGMLLFRKILLVFQKREQRYVRWIIFISFLIRVVLSIGLNKSDNFVCGQLHKVAITFYVFHYILFALIFGFLVIVIIQVLNR